MKLRLILLLTIITFAQCESSGPIYDQNIYRNNRGKKKTNKINQKLADREREHIRELEKMDKMIAQLEAGKKNLGEVGDATKNTINASIVEIENKIVELQNELKEISPWSITGHKRFEEISVEINDLLYKKVNPLSLLILATKEVKTLLADLTFNTGKSTLTDLGKTEIKEIVNTIKNDVKEWTGYLDNHNMNIFKEDRFKAMISIKGYADLQGPSNALNREKLNLKISQERADAVAAELEIEIDRVLKQENILYDIESIGKGEELPSNVVSNGKSNDAARRISTVSVVVAPVSLIKQ